MVKFSIGKKTRQKVLLVMNLTNLILMSIPNVSNTKYFDIISQYMYTYTCIYISSNLKLSS